MVKEYLFFQTVKFIRYCIIIIQVMKEAQKEKPRDQRKAAEVTKWRRRLFEANGSNKFCGKLKTQKSISQLCPISQ